MTDNKNLSVYEGLFFKTIIDSYVTNPRFIRRDWLADEVSEHLKYPDCRFVLLIAEPGAGKSGFLAQLASDHHNWVSYFIRKDQRDVFMDVGVHSFLLRIGYQLAASFPELFTREHIKIAVEQRVGQVEERGEVIGAEVKRLIASPFYSKIIQIQQDINKNKGTVVGMRIEELFVEPRLIDRKDLQHMALIDPALALLKHDPESKIVVLIDALDEVHYHETEGSLLKWLIECPELPGNVKFVLTSRPPEGELITFCNKKKNRIKQLTIDPKDDRVQRELKVYVSKLVTIPDVKRILTTDKTKVEDFSKEAVKKADGNIGYLDAIARGIDHALSVKVKNEIEGNSLLKGLLSLKDLPGDTQELYGFFLDQIKNSPSVRDKSIMVRDESTGISHFLSIWTYVYKPLLGVLSVAFEPLTIDQIHVLGSIIGSRDDVIEAKEWLRQFLDEDGNRFRFYHGTVQEFLTSAKTRELSKMTDHYIDPVKWHRFVSDFYWKAYHGAWSKLTDLYGLNYLARHLMEGRDPVRLFSLISKEWMEARLRIESTTLGFQTDVDLAWKTALSSEYDDNISSLVRLVRLKTLKDLLKIKAELSYDGPALYALTKLGKISIALANASIIEDPLKRLEAMIFIDQALSPEARKKVNLNKEILELAQGLNKGKKRGDALINVAMHMSETGRFNEAEEALLSFRATDIDKIKDEILYGIAKNNQLSAIEKVCNSIAKSGQTDRAVQLISKLKNTEGYIKLLDKEYVCILLRIANATVALDPAIAKDLFEKSIEISKSIGFLLERAYCLALVASKLAQLDLQKAQNLVLEADQLITNIPIYKNDNNRELAVLSLGVAMAKVGQLEHLDTLSDMIEEDARPRFRKVMPVYLADENAIEDALRIMDDAQLEQEDRAELLIIIGEKLSKSDNQRADSMLQSALKVVKTLASEDREKEYFSGHNDSIKKMIDDLVRVWASMGSFQYALDTANLMRDGNSAKSLIAIKMTFTDPNLVQEAIRIAENIDNVKERADTLKIIAGQLANTDKEMAGNLLDQAMGLISSVYIWDEMISLTLLKMSYAMVIANHDDIAFRLTELFPENSHYREESLELLAQALVQKGNFIRAEQVITDLTQAKSYESKSILELRMRVMISRERDGDISASKRTWESFLENKSKLFFSKSAKSELTLTLIENLLTAGQIQLALEFTNMLEDKRMWESSIVIVAHHLIKRGCYREALNSLVEGMKARWINYINLWESSLATIVGDLIEAGKLEDALLLAPTDGLFNCGSSWAKLGVELVRKSDNRAEDFLRLACKIIYSWQRNLYLADCPSEYSGIVASLMSVGDPRGYEFFNSVPQYVVPKLLVELVKNGLWDDAMKLTGRLDVETKKDILIKIAPYVVDEQGFGSSRLQTFIDLIYSLHDPKASWSPMIELSLAMVRSGKLKAALELHPIFPGVLQYTKEYPDFFIQSISMMAPYFEKVYPGFTLSAFKEITEVAGWMHKDWQPVRDLFQSVQQH